MLKDLTFGAFISEDVFLWIHAVVYPALKVITRKCTESSIALLLLFLHTDEIFIIMLI